MITKPHSMLQEAAGAVFLLALCQGIRHLFVSLSVLHICNQAGAFGVAPPSSLLLLFACISLIFFGVQWWREENSWYRVAWLLLMIGGASNLFERFFFDCVTDYIRFWSFPMFNLADVLITAGVFGIILKIVFREKAFKIPRAD